MSSPIDTHRYSPDLAGAVYFVVGRGTEGGNASYHLAIAGLTKGDPPNETGRWGKQAFVRDNSGYTLGTLQIDLGQRGTWPLGAISNKALKPGEKSYVDAIIEEVSSFATREGQPFTKNLILLRKQLLSHGHGKDGLQFIDTKTRDTINDWAQSEQGKSWIHQNMDMPQVRALTALSVDVLNRYGINISEEDRFKAICILAKTANQLPGLISGVNRKQGRIPGLTETIKAGGDYHALESRVSAQKAVYGSLDSDKAARFGSNYESHLLDPETAPALHRAHLKIMSPGYSSTNERQDPDIQRALDAFRRPAKQRLPRAELDPALQKSFDFIRGTLQSDGRWNPTEVENISAALLQATAANTAIQRIDRVIIGDPAPLDGQVRAFAQYRPHGELGPSISAHVVASQAASTPASHSLSQLSEAITLPALRHSAPFHPTLQPSDSPRLQA